MTPSDQSVTPCICGKPDCKIPYGLCHCGCKRETGIAKANRPEYWHVKGKPYKYFRGHSGAHSRPDTSGWGHFKIEGVYCRLIALTRGLFAIVNESDFEWLSQFLWYAAWVKNMRCYYAARHDFKKEGGKGKVLLMHREILGLKRGNPRLTDHIEIIATTDNRRKNLRDASVADNAHNTRRHRTNTTGVKGVHKPKGRRKFCVHLAVNGKNMHIGCTDTVEGGAKLRHEAALKYHGKFAKD